MLVRVTTMKRITIAVLALLAVSLSAEVQEKKDEKAGPRYPPPPIKKIFLATRGKKGWKPAIPSGFKLLDWDGHDVLDAAPTKNAVFVETDYFRILSTLPPQKLNPYTWPRIRETVAMLAPIYPQLRKKYPILKGKVLAHFIAVHMHRVMVDCWKVFGSDLDTYAQYFKDYKHGPYMRQKDKFESYFFGKRADYLNFADKFTGRGDTDGIRHRPPVTDVLVVLLPPPPGGAKNLNSWVATIVHNWVHNFLMSEIKNSWAIPIWLDVGFAHWFERREGPHDSYCFYESANRPRFTSGDWPPKIRTVLVSGESPDFAEFFDKKSLSDFSGVEHGICYGLLDYIIRERVKCMKPYCTVLRDAHRAGTLGQTRKHFRTAFGETPSTFFEKWREWAMENYSKAGRVAILGDPPVLGGKKGDGKKGKRNRR